MAEVLGERAYLAVLLPLRIWLHLACLTGGKGCKACYECVYMSLCVSTAGSGVRGHSTWLVHRLSRVRLQPERGRNKDSPLHG